MTKIKTSELTGAALDLARDALVSATGYIADKTSTGKEVWAAIAAADAALTALKEDTK